MKEQYLVLDEVLHSLQTQLNKAYEDGYRMVSHKMSGSRHVVIMELLVSMAGRPQ